MAFPPAPSFKLALLPLAFAISISGLLPAAATAQEPDFNEVPYADGQWNVGRRVDESQFRYCLDKRDPEIEVAGAIAEAIAAALLLEPQRFVVESDVAIENITKVYQVMLEKCDIHMGFKLIPEGYASWVTLTRAYYESQYVFVAADPAITSLADLPAGRPIGATMGTSAHIRLVSYLGTLPSEQRWPTFPMGTNELALQSLRDGSVGVALVWAPVLWRLKQDDPSYADLRVVDSAPLPPTTLGVGGLLLSNQTFLRSAVDQAIVALTADGTIESILEQFDFPATPAR